VRKRRPHPMLSLGIRLARNAYTPGTPRPLATFTTDEAMGAWPNGTRIRKEVFTDGDAHGIGELGTVVGSIGPLEGHYGYFIRWDDMPHVPVFVVGNRIGRASDD